VLILGYFLKTKLHQNAFDLETGKIIWKERSPYSEPMLGSNHQQARNDSNTKNRLMQLFEGALGDYFITPERN